MNVFTNVRSVYGFSMCMSSTMIVPRIVTRSLAPGRQATPNYLVLTSLYGRSGVQHSVTYECAVNEWKYNGVILKNDAVLDSSTDVQSRRVGNIARQDQQTCYDQPNHLSTLGPGRNFVVIIIPRNFRAKLLSMGSCIVEHTAGWLVTLLSLGDYPAHEP